MKLEGKMIKEPQLLTNDASVLSKSQRNATTETFTLASLFSGCGGLDLGFAGGFEYLGEHYAKRRFNHIFANELNSSASATFAHNFPDVDLITADARKLFADGLVKHSSVDVLTGGFPCQDFSLAGKRAGLNVERGKLYLAMVEAVKELRPRVFLAENVRGLVTWEKGLALEVIASDFAMLGYKVEYRILNAADFGVPQIRKRVIIIGVRADLKPEFTWPLATHSIEGDSKLPTWISSQKALADLEDDSLHFDLPNSSYSKAKVTVGRQGNKPIPRDAPAPTIRAEHHGNIEFHYQKDRRLSAREAARLQSFPDGFKFLNSTTDAYRQIGNAVAPVFAWHLAGAVESFLSRSSNT